MIDLDDLIARRAKLLGVDLCQEAADALLDENIIAFEESLYGELDDLIREYAEGDACSR